MKQRLFRLLSIFLFLAAAPVPAQSPSVEKDPVTLPSAPSGGVVVIPLKGEINSAQLAAFKSALAQATKDSATALIVEIDTTGGDASVAAEEVDALLAVHLPTASFINPQALSAGAVVALAADKIYLHPSATIGAGSVITKGADKATDEKSVATLAAKAREAAKAKGHPEDLAEAFVRLEAEVKRGEQVLDGPTTLLTLSAAEATEKHYGHPLLADGLAADAATVAQLAGFSGTIRDSATGASISATPAPAPAKGSSTVVLPGVAGPIFVIPINGEVGPTQSTFLRRALKEAQRANASAVILDVDTFGGRVDSAMEEMDALLSTRTPTIAFVHNKAISAGSLISLAAKKIYMTPQGVIGASAVVGGGGETLDKTMSEKATSMVVAKARGAAKANGHPEDIAEAFVRLESEVSRDGKIIDGKTTLLSLNGTDAIRVYGGQPLLAAGLANDVDDLVRVAGLSGPIKHFDPSGFETLAFWITELSPLLLLGGIVGAYIEMKAPGFGIPGICSLICFGLFFGGHYIAGLAGAESIVVFLIGLALVIVEIFVLPGTIIPGLIGVMMMLGALVWAMVDHWPAEGGSGWSMPTGAELERPILNLIIAVAGASVAVMLLAKFLPKTAFYQRLVLSNAVPAGPGVTVPVVNMSVRAGDTGTASTLLRPAGKATIGGEVHDVVSAGGFISPGSAIRVVSTDGMRVVVEPV